MAKKKSVTLVPGDNKVTVIPMTAGDKAASTKQEIKIEITVTIHPDGKVTAAEGDILMAAATSLMIEGLPPIKRALIRVARAVKKELVGDVA